MGSGFNGVSGLTVIKRRECADEIVRAGCGLDTGTTCTVLVVRMSHRIQ